MGRVWKAVLIGMCLACVLGIHPLAHAVEWQDVAGDLMSPACPGRTLLNCTSSQAEQWRELIRQKLARGESKKQIIQYFVDIEGESILAAPPKQGFALTVWLFPAFVILNGAVMILLLTRRWTQRTTHSMQDNTPLAVVPPDADPRNSSPQADVVPISQDNFARYQARLRKELDEFNA
jgi:cytochrome c-type biogenesis protein CcmH